jgi:hypothetical protein
MVAQIFAEGYHREVWAGKEAFLPAGVPAYELL